MATLKADAVFEGGGVKGIGLVGALFTAEQDYHVEWQRVAGTSAGAVVAALVAAGYTANEIYDIIKEKVSFAKMMDRSLVDRIPLIGPAVSLGFEKGIFEGKYLEDTIRDYLAAKGVHTFKDLPWNDPRGTSPHPYRLQLIAADVSLGRMVVLPRDVKTLYGMNPGDFDVARAVRMSISIPFFFEPVRLRYKHSETGDERESYIVDGGLLSNFPIWLFDSNTAPRWPTFGFRLSGNPEAISQEQLGIAGPISFLVRMFFTTIEAHAARAITPENEARTIQISTDGVDGTDFNLSDDAKETLYSNGRRAATDFFARWDFEEYKRKYR